MPLKHGVRVCAPVCVCAADDKRRDMCSMLQLCAILFFGGGGGVYGCCCRVYAMRESYWCGQRATCMLVCTFRGRGERAVQRAVHGQRE